MQKKNNRKLGSDYEELAALWLAEQGFTVLERNFRCKAGEIDLIAREDPYIAFVEVKYRSGEWQGAPADAVDRHKQRNISRVAASYMLKMHLPEDTPCRFDVVALSPKGIVLYRDAFPFQL